MIVNVTESALLASLSEGEPMLKVGAVVSTLNVVDGPPAAAEFAAASVAVAAANEIPTVPFPVHELSETVRVDVPVPETAIEQSAVPVLFKLTSLTAVVTAVAPE